MHFLKVLSIMEFGPNQTAPPPVINIPTQTSRQSIHEITIILKYKKNKRNKWKINLYNITVGKFIQYFKQSKLKIKIKNVGKTIHINPNKNSFKTKILILLTTPKKKKKKVTP